MKIGTREFETSGQTYVMGILNVTPDSFSDGGRYDKLDAALKHVEEMCDGGVDVLDIGGGIHPTRLHPAAGAAGDGPGAAGHRRSQSPV